MKYEKSALTFEEQADKLLARGLEAEKAELVARLQAVSYYRLSGYLYPFRKSNSERFKAGTHLYQVWERYCFDRRLRVLLLDAIERIEVSIRTKLVYHFTHAHGPFGYLHDANLPKLKIGAYLEWRLALQEETSRSKEAFKTHFFKKYGEEHKSLPLWMLAELMSMGSTLTLLKGISPDLKRKVASEYGYPDELILSWLLSLNAARNLCAHHARLWNRVMGYPPKLPSPNKYPSWHSSPKPPNDRIGLIILICRSLLTQISPTSRWKERVESLFEEYPNIPICHMGLTPNWNEHPVWKA
ncbi:Abi family protein [Pelagicoccus enzymogenes]|uniref:Abi family protein n=1 Tax=Pelagicoccus enzymogenes TaxID=2773457 RepID=UPI00280F160B|nr:Abi family protein [Pelagicoccus enzymogenes]MDQ8198188.1 Abi family protein [Pelagicoccus enzymogenes]